MTAIIIQKRDTFFHVLVVKRVLTFPGPPASLTGDKKRWAERFNLSKIDIYLGLDM